MYKSIGPFKLKAVDDEQGIIEGYAARFGNLDSDNEVIEKGAFTKTLAEGALQRTAFLRDHVRGDVLGPILDAGEDDTGLWFKAKLTLGATLGRDTYELVKDEALREVSVGVDLVKHVWKEGVRHLTELALFDISIVTWAANPQARILTVKSAVPFGDLPLASDDTAWDAAAAKKRVASWAGGPEKEGMDWEKYRGGFFWYDADNPEAFGSYKLPFADVINGKLLAVPRGIMATAAVLMGGRGGVDLPPGEDDKVKSVVGKYYAKMDRTPPWEGKSKALDFDAVLADRTLAETYWYLLDTLSMTLSSVVFDVELDDAEKPAQAVTVCRQFTDGITKWLDAALERGLLSPAETQVMMEARPPSITKEGRVLSSSNAKLVAQCRDALTALLTAAEVTEPDSSTPTAQAASKGAATSEAQTLTLVLEQLRKLTSGGKTDG